MSEVWRFAVGLLLLLFFEGAVSASTSNVVTNGSFESGATGWTLFGQGSGVAYALTNDAADGVSAMRASSRTNLSHHVTQTITANLLAESNHVYFGIEFSILASAPENARCTLQLVDSAGTSTIILAEKVIDAETGRWVNVRGGRTISWQGTLTSASLRFEIGQITEHVYPATILDRIRIVRDSDRDGLTDDLDPVPDNADANTNQLPDGWEAFYHLPGAPGTADTDGDGFTDAQEYWTATDPTNNLVVPARPANTNATAETRAVLRYLALLPSFPTQRVIVGQVVTDTGYDYTNQVITLAAQASRWPAMLGVVYDMINGPINVPGINPYATNYWNAGGLVHVQWNPDNPWNGFFSGNTNNIDFPALFTPGSPSHTNYIAIMDEVANGLRQLGDAGLTVLFRPLNENNSFQNWYQRRARSDYIALYRWTFDYLAKSQALNHVLWVYDSLSAPHATVPVTYYYPGNDVVDVFGVNVYDDDWTLPYDLDRLSRDYPKPLAIPEGGPLSIIDGTFSNLTYITGISNNFPRVSYFGIYNSFPAAGNTSTTHYSLVDNIGSAALLDHPWVVTREELGWRAYLGPFGAWQLQHFSTNANMAGIAGWGADPDADVAPNLFEYALGTDPLAHSSAALVPGDHGISFTRNTNATDVGLSIQAADDLSAGAWPEVAAKSGNSPWTPDPGFTVTEYADGSVTLTDGSLHTSRYFRMLINQP